MVGTIDIVPIVDQSRFCRQTLTTRQSEYVETILPLARLVSPSRAEWPRSEKVHKPPSRLASERRPPKVANRDAKDVWQVAGGGNADDRDAGGYRP